MEMECLPDVSVPCEQQICEIFDAQLVQYLCSSRAGFSSTSDGPDYREVECLPPYNDTVSSEVIRSERFAYNFKLCYCRSASPWTWTVSPSHFLRGLILISFTIYLSMIRVKIVTIQFGVRANSHTKVDQTPELCC